MSNVDKLLDAYQKMLERVKDFANEQGTKLKQNIDKAKEKAVDLEELTKHEAEQVAQYLQRDLEDAGSFLAETGQDFKTWFKFDMELIEQRYLEKFLSVADQTRLEWLNLEKQAKWDSEYHTGQITGIGTLVCTNCNEQVHFHKAGHIPPCPKCQHTVFKRSSE